MSENNNTDVELVARALVQYVVESCDRYSVADDKSSFDFGRFNPYKMAEAVLAALTKRDNELATHCYSVENWDCTYDMDIQSELFENALDCGEVLEVGYLKTLPSKFFIKYYDEEKDEYVTESFATKELAELALTKHKGE